MDFANLLELAKQNSEDASKTSVKRYSTNLKPSKKLEKGNVNTRAIKDFLARKETEEKVKVKEAYYKKEELLSIRSQNSKSSKKAKLMASRTKDNDFSKIRLTTDEEDSKKKIDLEIQRRMISDKIERMKARIELEEREKLLPRKRKRKSKANENNNGSVQTSEQNEDFSDNETLKVEEKKISMHRSPVQPMNFHDLLKLASKKQHEPVELPKVVKKEERPMTEKEKRRYEEEQLRKKGISVYTLPDISRQKSKQKKFTSTNEDMNKTSVFSESVKNRDIKTSQTKSNSVNNKTFQTVKKAGGLYQDIRSEHRKVPNYEDDDLDDFIDDTPIDENIDVSRQIQEIFRYNKNKYESEDYDDDDDVMESSFVQQMKEECRSARIGMMEDLEDIKREKDETKRKLMKKKTLKR